MNSTKTIRIAPNLTEGIISNDEIKTELFRKGIHLLVAIVPFSASINLLATQLLLLSSVVLYSLCETLRLSGHNILFVSNITDKAARIRDNGQFVMGPVTLALGALLSIMIFPSFVAAIAIYALAFGDTAASIIGKFFGKIKIPGLKKKTLEGFFACFLSIFLITYGAFADVKKAFAVAFTASIVELVPIKDLDNILIPLASGMVAIILI